MKLYPIFITLVVIAGMAIAYEEKNENVQVAFRPQYAYFIFDYGEDIPAHDYVPFRSNATRKEAGELTSHNIILSNDTKLISNMDEGIYEVEMAIVTDAGSFALQKRLPIMFKGKSIQVDDSLLMVSNRYSNKQTRFLYGFGIIDIHDGDVLGIREVSQLPSEIKFAAIKLVKIANLPPVVINQNQ